MSVTALDLPDALAISDETPTHTPVNKNFFQHFGTTGCLLGCHSTKHVKSDLGLKHNTPPTITTRKVRAAQRRYKKELDAQDSWFTIAQLVESVDNGCGSCGLINRILACIFPGNATRSPEMYKYAFDCRWELRCKKIGEASQATVQLFQPPNVSVHFEQMPTSKLLLGRTKSLVRLKVWLANCLGTHIRCAAREIPWTDDMRPARLLDVSVFDSNGNPGLRLFETVAGVSYTYVCLSHRWDKGIEPHKTTTENLEAKLTFITSANLPGNFSDAVQLTREIGIQYLWIDSICIIQDGDEGQDLKREIAKMGYIYQNAHLVVAAVSSPDSNAGCFMHDNWPDISLGIRDLDGASSIIGARMLDRKGKALTINEVNDRFPLLTRAWVFQERLLSTRLVQCNYGEFQYACLESLTCECTASSLAPHPSQKAIRNATYLGERHMLLKGSKVVRNQGSLSSWKRNVLSYWRTLTQEYMQHSISYSSDVLPAIGGCAQVLAHHLQTYEDLERAKHGIEPRRIEYVAGMWKDTLAMDLLWYVRFQTYPAPRDAQGKIIRPDKAGIAQNRPLDSTAPSWSWASVPMRRTIAYMGWDEKSHEWTSTQMLLTDETLKEVYCRPEYDGNPFGRLSIAYLRLKATLYPWYIRFFCYVAKRENSYETRNRPDVFAKRKEHFMRCSTDRHREINVHGAFLEFCLDANTRREDMTTEPFTGCVNTGPSHCALAGVFLLHVLHKEKPSRTLDVFLVLQRIDSKHGQPNCYKRIGLWNIIGLGDNIMTWQQIAQDQITARKEELWLF